MTMYFGVEFYSIDRSEDSDPDPTWKLNKVPARDIEHLADIMLRFCQLLIDVDPLMLDGNANETGGGGEWQVIDAIDETPYGTLYAWAVTA